METKITATLEMQIDMDELLSGAQLTKQTLRDWSRKKREEMEEKFGFSFNIKAEVFCNEEQRRLAAGMIGFVQARDFGNKIPERLDFGAFENFLFKWKH